VKGETAPSDRHDDYPTFPVQGQVFHDALRSAEDSIDKEKRYMFWYAVKLLYRMNVSGEPNASLTDDHYSERDLFFEESVLLVPAGSFEEAYEKAETEAKKKANVYENKYGQTVTVGFYKAVDCFKLFESPQAFTEAYSAIFCEEPENVARRYERCTAEEMHVLRQKQFAHR